MATSSFSISYIIKAVDKFSPVIKKVQKSLKGLDKNIAGIGTKGIKKLADKTKKVETNFKKVAEQTQKVKAKIQTLPPKIDVVTAKTNKAALSAKRLGDRFKRVGDRIKGLGAKLSLRATLPIAALFTVSIANAKTQAEAEARVELGLKNIGNQAFFTKKELLGMAGALQDISVFGDEQVLEQITAPLLQIEALTKSKNLFADVQKLIVNIASFKGAKDFTKFTKLLGQAISDPALGAEQVKSFAVLTEEIKNQIKVLQEGGDLEGARLLLFKAIAEKFKGAAQGLRDTDFGQITGNLNLIGDATEPIGFLVTKALIPLANMLGTLLKKWLALNPQTQKWVVITLALTAALAPALLALSFLLTAVAAIGLPISLIVLAIAGLTFAFIKFNDEIQEVIIDLLGEDGFAALLNIIDVIKNSFIDTFKVIFGLIGKFFSIIGKVIKFFSGGRKEFLGLNVEEFRKIAFEAKGPVADFGGLGARDEPLGEAGRNFGVRSTVDLNMNIRDKGNNVESIQATPGVNVATTKGSNSPFRLSDLAGAV